MNILDDIKYSLNKIKEKILSLDPLENNIEYLETYIDDPDLSTLYQILKNLKFEDIKGKNA